MYCLGTYIRNASGVAIAGMAVSFLQGEYESKREEVSAVLIELAEQIEQRLGLITHS
jgi:DNA-binding IclR family transcriptional regulator